jgi:hypothetical protein
MRSFLVFSLLLLIIACGKKTGEDDQATLQPDSVAEITLTARATLPPPPPPAEILASLKPLSLPFNTESLPRNEDWRQKEIDQVILTALHEETVESLTLRLRDSLDQPADEPPKMLPDSYWALGTIGKQNEYTTVVIGSSIRRHGVKDVEYTLITFTPDGKIIDKLVISEEEASEGDRDDTESVIQANGNITTTQTNIYSEPYDILGRKETIIYSIDHTGKFKQESRDQQYKETVVDWYDIPEAGLLSIEKGRGNSIHFSLVVGSGESCTGAVSGMASLQPGGKSFIYRSHTDSETPSCTLTFVPGLDKMVLTEEGDICEHGFKCQFAGTYKKITSEKISGVPYSVRFWLGKPVGEFTCELTKLFSYVDDKFKCGAKAREEWDPEDLSYYAGPAFPQEKIKTVHPLLSGIDIAWEHGEIQAINFKFEKELSVESVQRIFNLPRTKQDWSVHFGDIFDIFYGGFTEEDIASNDLKLLRIESLTLVAFEHMGSGD